MAKKKADNGKPSGTKKRVAPDLVAILVCDSVMQAMPVGKPVVMGVFDRIIVANPENKFRPFSVLIKLFGGHGKFSLGIRVDTPVGELKLPETTQDIDCDPETMHQGILVIEGLDVSKEGWVKISVTLDGKPFGNPYPVRIIHKK